MMDTLATSMQRKIHSSWQSGRKPLCVQFSPIGRASLGVEDRYVHWHTLGVPWKVEPGERAPFKLISVERAMT